MKATKPQKINGFSPNEKRNFHSPRRENKEKSVKMKVYIHYEDCEDEERHTTLKIKVPKKWRSGPVEKLKNVRRRRRSKNESSIFLRNAHTSTVFY